MTGHLARECRQPKKMDKINRAYDEIRGRPRRGRSRRSGGGGGGNGGSTGNQSSEAPQKVSVNALMDALGKISLVDEEAKEEQKPTEKSAGN